MVLLITIVTCTCQHLTLFIRIRCKKAELHIKGFIRSRNTTQDILGMVGIPYDVTPVITWIDWNNFRSSFWATLWLNRYPHAFILSIFHGANSSLADLYHSDPDLKNFLTDPDPGKKEFCTYQEIIKKIAKIVHFPSIKFFGITFL